MSRVFYIGDTHFGHHNIAVLRGFENATEHDDKLIMNWNSVVTKRDTVYLMGDVAMDPKYYPLLNLLNGRKIVVLGNHEERKNVKELMEYVDQVCGYSKRNKALLSHIPVHPSQKYRFKHNIHAHLHDGQIDDDWYICVSAERINYTPVLADSIH